MIPLYGISILYLYLPLLIFSWGWLRPEVAAAVTALLAGCAWHFRAELRSRFELCRRSLVGTLLVAVGWTVCVGAGGLGYPNGDDWRKHNAVLKDLTLKTWPVVYDYPVAGIEGDRHALVFYFAYHLPAAVVGKVAGWKAANYAIFLWTLLGTVLVLLWVERLVGGRPGVAALLFVFASGMDALGILLRGQRLFAPTEHLEVWASVWQLSSDTTLLFWVPHQALGGWLATALLIDGAVRARRSSSALLESFGALLWSPLACIGLLPFAALRLLRQPREWLRAWPTWTAFPLLGGLLLAFYAALRISILPAFVGGEIFGPLAGNYLLFTTLEFGLFFWVCRGAASGEWRLLWWIAGVSLALIPFGRIGYYNDFVMRVSIPALFALWLLVAKGLLGGDLPKRRRWLLAGMVLVGALTAGAEFTRSFKLFRVRIAKENRVREVPRVHALPELNVLYLGDPEAPFFRYLARRQP